MNPVHFVKIKQSDGIEELFIKASEVERVIKDIEEFKAVCEQDGMLEGIPAFEFCLTLIKELLPK